MSTFSVGGEENGVREEYRIVLNVIASHVNNPVDIIKCRNQKCIYFFRGQSFSYLCPLLLDSEASIFDIVDKHFGLRNSGFF